jgi:hypothetical protein
MTQKAGSSAKPYRLEIFETSREQGHDKKHDHPGGKVGLIEKLKRGGRRLGVLLAPVPRQATTANAPEWPHTNPSKHRRVSRFNGLGRWLLLVSLLPLSACIDPEAERAKARREKAMAMWQERCKKSGEFIHETVDGVEGVYLMKLRPGTPNYSDQFLMDDPYGRDSGGEGSVEGFLKHEKPEGIDGRRDDIYHDRGYRYVVAKSPEDGNLYRYEGKMIEPWQSDKRYLKGYVKFVFDKAPATEPLPRYGVTYDDISTREEREYWIAGSSLKVVDLKTNRVIAERIGYMVDAAQGSRAGQRSPWLKAAGNACPVFVDPSAPKIQPAGAYQSGQTYRFVAKVLKPKK